MLFCVAFRKWTLALIFDFSPFFNENIHLLQLTPNGDPDLKALYDEELAVAKDAIGNLRSTFG